MRNGSLVYVLRSKYCPECGHRLTEHDFGYYCNNCNYEVSLNIGEMINEKILSKL